MQVEIRMAIMDKSQLLQMLENILSVCQDGQLVYDTEHLIHQLEFDEINIREANREYHDLSERFSSKGKDLAA